MRGGLKGRHWEGDKSRVYVFSNTNKDVRMMSSKNIHAWKQDAKILRYLSLWACILKLFYSYFLTSPCCNFPAVDITSAFCSSCVFQEQINCNRNCEL